MLYVFLDGLLSYLQCVSDFFVSPSLREILHYGLFAISKLEFFLGLVSIQMLASAQFFHGYHQAGMLYTAFIG